MRRARSAPGRARARLGLRARFQPLEIGRVHEAQVDVTYVVDPFAGTTATRSILLHGEGVSTGVRVLVRSGGAPVDLVERVQLQRIVGGRGINETLRDLPLASVAGPVPELSFPFHAEWGATTSPGQLLTGNYEVTATIRANGNRSSRTLFFSLDTCDFNPLVVVDF